MSKNTTTPVVEAEIVNPVTPPATLQTSLPECVSSRLPEAINKVPTKYAIGSVLALACVVAYRIFMKPEVKVETPAPVETPSVPTKNA